jgi:hypothetical protein
MLDTPMLAERCDLCGLALPDDHRHLLHLEERMIVCVCESCRALFPADGPYRPTGTTAVVLDDLDLSDELWASFQIPIGLAFFFTSGVARRGIALYPSAAGATESELDLEAWEELAAANPVLETLEPDIEGLIVNRLGEIGRYALAPIDECYRLVGLIKASWQGIGGGSAVERAAGDFFAALDARALG